MNGCPNEEFKFRRGLRQCDPLASFLFLIVAEGLAWLVRKAKSKNIFEGMQISMNRV